MGQYQTASKPLLKKRNQDSMFEELTACIEPTPFISKIHVLEKNVKNRLDEHLRINNLSHELFSQVPGHLILSFLKEIRLYHKFNVSLYLCLLYSHYLFNHTNSWHIILCIKSYASVLIKPFSHVFHATLYFNPSTS